LCVKGEEGKGKGISGAGDKALRRERAWSFTRSVVSCLSLLPSISKFF